MVPWSLHRTFALRNLSKAPQAVQGADCSLALRAGSAESVSHIMHPFVPFRCALLMALVGLTSCISVGPDYRPPELEVPSAWNRCESFGAEEGCSFGEVDITEWWRELSDPLLAELIAEALQTNHDLRIARWRLVESRARRRVAAASLLPDASGSASARRNWSRGDSGGWSSTDRFSAGFDAGWELDLFGGRRRTVEAADAALESTAAGVHSVQVSLVAEVALNYVEMRLLQQRLSIARDNLATQSETLQLTEWRARAGLVSEQDVEQARSQQAQTRAQLPRLETSLIETEHRLELLLGQAPGTLAPRFEAGGALPAVPRHIVVGIPAEVLRQRPDLRAAERNLAAETARVGAAEAARYPSLRLSGSIGLDALTLGGLGSSRALSSSVLGGLSAPIFNAGRLKAQVEQQEAVREQALAAYELTLLGALEEVENALVAFAHSQQRSEALNEAAEAIRRAAVLARQRYSAGLVDFQSVLDTERGLLTVEDSLAGSRADTVQSLIRLYKALGGGWPSQADKEPS